LSSKPVLIVGAGLAGLACATELHRRQIPFQLIEASDAPGGRVRTDQVDGFLLDRGFQVYLTAYPEGQKLLDYKRLQFGHFAPGALIHLNDKFHSVMDPWREPFAALSQILNPVGSMRDKLLVARLRAVSLAGRPEDLLTKPETTTLEALRRYGFSENMIDRFFRPFFGGIMLDASLSVSSRMLEYVFRMMATGDTVLPAQGMGAIPAQLAEKLPADSIRCNAPVESISSKELLLANGDRLHGSAVVVATDGAVAHKLIPQLPMVGARMSMTLYYAIEGKPPWKTPLILLNGNLDWPIQNVCLPNLICPSYAPAGQNLLSVTVLGDPSDADQKVDAAVRQQLGGWFQLDTAAWRLLRVYRIRNAHPARQPDSVLEMPPSLGDGRFVCGDHRFMASIQAAMLSGRRAAEAVAEYVA
jgi:phytoene dehydrogenase-like protein